LEVKKNDYDREMVGTRFSLLPGQRAILGRDKRFVHICVGLFGDASRIHAAVSYTEEEGVLLKDLGSTNGTFVNRERLIRGERNLKDGDSIHLGVVELLFVDKDSI